MARSCSGVSRNSVSGTPMSLLKLPAVASTFPCVRSMAASISLTVVLPLLPVIAMVFGCTLAFTAAPSKPNAWRVFCTTICGTCSAGNSTLRSTSNALAPLATASATKSWASKLSPCKAINKQPSGRLRVSVLTSVIVQFSPNNWPSTARQIHCKSVLIMCASHNWSCH